MIMIKIYYINEDLAYLSSPNALKAAPSAVQRWNYMGKPVCSVYNLFLFVSKSYKRRFDYGLLGAMTRMLLPM